MVSSQAWVIRKELLNLFANHFVFRCFFRCWLQIGALAWLICPKMSCIRCELILKLSWNLLLVWSMWLTEFHFLGVEITLDLPNAAVLTICSYAIFYNLTISFNYLYTNKLPYDSNKSQYPYHHISNYQKFIKGSMQKQAFFVK